METWEFNRQLVFPHMKQVAHNLRRSYEWVRRQCANCLGHSDYYGAFWRWVCACEDAIPNCGDFYISDLAARLYARRKRGELERVDWNEAVAHAIKEGAESVAEAVLDKHLEKIERELLEDIESKQLLLALVKARTSNRSES